MTDCTLANTAARKLAIRPTGLLFQVPCATGLHVKSVVQSTHGARGEDRSKGFAEGAAGIVEAAGNEIEPSSFWRNRPLCNECRFAVGHGQAERIGACLTDSEVLA